MKYSELRFKKKYLADHLDLIPDRPQMVTSHHHWLTPLNISIMTGDKGALAGAQGAVVQRDTMSRPRNSGESGRS